MKSYVALRDVIEIELPRFDRYRFSDDELVRWKDNSGYIVNGNQYQIISDEKVDQYRKEIIRVVNQHLENIHYPAKIGDIGPYSKSTWIVKYNPGGYVKTHKHDYLGGDEMVSVILTFDDFDKPTFTVNGKDYYDKPGKLRLHNSKDIEHSSYPQERERTVLVADFALLMI